MKVDKQMSLTDLSQMLQKMSIRIWNQSWELYCTKEDKRKRQPIQSLSRIPQDKNLLPDDVEQAKRLFILTQMTSSIEGAQGTVQDVFSYLENKLKVTCVYETAYDYFESQV